MSMMGDSSSGGEDGGVLQSRDCGLDEPLLTFDCRAMVEDCVLPCVGGFEAI